MRAEETFMKIKEKYYSNRTDLLSVGIANIGSVPGDLKTNQDKIIVALEIFSKRKVNLVLFPEYSISGNFWKPEDVCRAYIEEQACISQLTSWLEAVSQTFIRGTLEYIVFNGFEKTNDNLGKYYNTTFFLDRNNHFPDRNNTYRKTFLPGGEKHHILSGISDSLILNTCWGKFGFLTCYDICFPHLFLPLAHVEKVDGIIVLSAWKKQGKREYNALNIRDNRYYQTQWDIMTQALAAQNQAWVMGANAVGPHTIQGVDYCGSSGVWAPSGINLMKASDTEEELLILHNIDIQKEVEKEKEEFSYTDDVTYNPMSLT